MKKGIIGVLAIGIFLFTAGGSYLMFSTLLGGGGLLTPAPKTAQEATKEEGGNDYDALVFDQSLPKTEECPINGALYSTQQKKWWETHRPLGVMIENSVDARPQSGISFADITYEAVAEGGISRTLNIFYCQDAGRIGPVRSARTYFLDWMSEYGNDPIYQHYGAANCNRETGSGCLNGAKADARGQMNKYGWAGVGEIDGLSVGVPVFRGLDFDGVQLATEHTKYSNTNVVWDYAKNKRGLTQVDKEGVAWDEDFKPYSFKDDPKTAERPTSQVFSLFFWENMPNYEVTWTYNPKDNLYSRVNGSKAHIDRNTKKQLTAKTVAVLFQKESNANDGYDGNVHLLYGTTGSGKAQIFMDGKEIKGTWKKANRLARTTLFDQVGKEIVFTRGKIWFEILPLESSVTVE